jgi:hypothetical protein
MKEISEEMQMRIFDLLEGNLSETEKTLLLQEIAESAALQREYTLMSKTYFEVEPLVYANKTDLYRPKRGMVYFIPMQRYAAAAAVLLLAAGGWYFMKKQNPSALASISNVKTKGESTPKINLTPNASQPNIQEGIRKEHSKALQQDKTPDKIGSIAPPIIEAVEVVQDKPVQSPIAIKPELIAQIENTEPTLDSSATAGNEKAVVPISKKRSLSYKLLQNSRTMLANLQLPDIKFKTEKKANSNIPTVKMEIHTYKTDVIATLID